MIMKSLEKFDSKIIRSKLDTMWDIKHCYWYPLFDCNRQDIIAFDSGYIESRDKQKIIGKLLKEHGVETLYEFEEDGTSNQIIDFISYILCCSEPYFCGSEYFWFDENMDWIIYTSHEGTTTIGGKWLVEQLKEIWSDWASHISWDTKN
jgi:hypothetical protein